MLESPAGAPHHSWTHHTVQSHRKFITTHVSNISDIINLKNLVRIWTNMNIINNGMVETRWNPINIGMVATYQLMESGWPPPPLCSTRCGQTGWWHKLEPSTVPTKDRSGFSSSWGPKQINQRVAVYQGFYWLMGLTNSSIIIWSSLIFWLRLKHIFILWSSSFHILYWDFMIIILNHFW